MTAVGYTASSGVAMPEEPWGWSPQQVYNRYSEVPALKQAGRAWDHRVGRAKRARSLQGAGTASGDEGQSLHNRQELDSAPTIVEQLQAATRQIHAMGQFIESKLDGACNLYSGMRLENPRRYAEQWAEQQQALRLLALREHARELALAHVGICKSAAAADGTTSWGMHFSFLMREWKTTAEVVLTPEMKREISDHFGNEFVMFLKADHALYSTAPDVNTTYTVSLDMPWTERALLIEAIDKISTPFLRDGGRVAYLVFFGAQAWKEKKKKFAHKPAVPCVLCGAEISKQADEQIMGYDCTGMAIHIYDGA